MRDHPALLAAALCLALQAVPLPARGQDAGPAEETEGTAEAAEEGQAIPDDETVGTEDGAGDDADGADEAAGAGEVPASSPGEPAPPWGTEFGKEPPDAELLAFARMEADLIAALAAEEEAADPLPVVVAGPLAEVLLGEGGSQGKPRRARGLDFLPGAVAPLDPHEALASAFGRFLGSPWRAGARADTGAGTGPELTALFPARLHPTRFDLPVTLNHRVMGFLRFFLGRGKFLFAGWLARMGRYRSLIVKTLREEGLPLDLLYLAMVESGFNPRALSPARACGIWQFIESTAREYGLAVDYWVDERRDPVKSTRAAARFLKDLHMRFGTWELAMAAYNGGPALIAGAIRRYNSNDYWEISKYGYLPMEARFYVPKVLAAALVGKNLDLFALTAVGAEAPYEYDEVPVPGGTSLEVVARACGVAPAVITDLNPELRRGVTPPGTPAYRVRIPPRTRDAFLAAFPGLQVGAARDFLRHRVRFGETIRRIACTYGVTAEVIRLVNQLPEPFEPPGDSVVVVPVPRGRRVGRGGTGAGADVEAGERIVVVPDIPFYYPDRQRLFFEVPHGYTARQVADFFDVEVADLAMWNRLDLRARLQPGMVLQVFAPRDFDPAAAVVLDPARIRLVEADSETFHEVVEAARRHNLERRRPPAYGATTTPGRDGSRLYTVRPGDILGTIARRFGCRVEDILRANRGLRAERLRPGDRIRIPSGAPRRGR